MIKVILEMKVVHRAIINQSIKPTEANRAKVNTAEEYGDDK